MWLASTSFADCPLRILEQRPKTKFVCQTSTKTYNVVLEVCKLRNLSDVSERTNHLYVFRKPYSLRRTNVLLYFSFTIRSHYWYFQFHFNRLHTVQTNKHDMYFSLNALTRIDLSFSNRFPCTCPWLVKSVSCCNMIFITFMKGILYKLPSLVLLQWCSAALSIMYSEQELHPHKEV